MTTKAQLPKGRPGSQREKPTAVRKRGFTRPMHGDLGKVDSASATAAEPAHWTFLTNHAHILILLSQNPSIVLRNVAARVGITERAVQRIIADLEEADFIEREKVGRQNHYRVLADQPLRHPIEAHRSIGDLLQLISATAD